MFLISAQDGGAQGVTGKDLRQHDPERTSPGAGVGGWELPASQGNRSLMPGQMTQQLGHPARLWGWTGTLISLANLTAQDPAGGPTRPTGRFLARCKL